MFPASLPPCSRPTLAQAVQPVDFPTTSPSMTSKFYTLDEHYRPSIQLYYTTSWFFNKFYIFSVNPTSYSHLIHHTIQTLSFKDSPPPISLRPLTHAQTCTHTPSIHPVPTHLLTTSQHPHSQSTLDHSQKITFRHTHPTKPLSKRLLYPLP